MIQVLGLKKNLKIDIREKFSIIQKHVEEKTILLSEVCNEVVLLSTCNRTEIYFSSSKSPNKIIDEIFEKMNWDNTFKDSFFYYKNEEAIEHLMDVVCGFDSLILGEDQILGQVKEAYEVALRLGILKSKLKKLFQLVVTCGKEFRNVSQLNMIPVSSSSIAVNEARKKGCAKFMVLGFGNVGELVCKYILSGKFDVLYIVVRNINVVNIDDKRVKVIPFCDRQIHYNEVDCVISCTSAPHTVIWKNQLPINKKLEIFDLAVPRDAEEEVYKMNNVHVYDIDEISSIDLYNKEKRKSIMIKNRYIIDKYIIEFFEWDKIQKVVDDIIKIKKYGENVYKKRYRTFKNKQHTKDNEKLASTLIKSASDAYTNRAIEVLKEEQLKGCGDECLRIIRKIFYEVQ
ncbi:glutamyl-tRNA reductase [Clostridium neuense]|uniref:Glutamyl-tRNA reductase n=1 Tax=Clostridium neuense TaxID=1728934 RepID=A0ABW8TIL8_9CLOT